MPDVMPGSSWLRRLTLRTRIVAVAAVVVTVVLVVGGVLLGWALERSLQDELREGAAQRATELAAIVTAGELPRRIPHGDQEDAFAQVVVGSRVVAATANAQGLPPLDLAEASPEGGIVELDDVSLPIDDDGEPGERELEEFLVVVDAVRTGNGVATVYVGTSLQDVEETIAEAISVAIAGLPFLVAALAVAIWVLVGHALAPVEAIRAEADAIGGRELDRRVPEPTNDDEVGRLARTLNRMLGRLQSSSEQQRRFVADAAHELRTPIASVRTQLETAKASPRDLDWDAVADDVLAETTRMQLLTEQLLLLARSDAGTLSARREPVDLDDIVTGVASGRDVDTSGVSPVQVEGDPILLEQVVRNLLDNAERHARSRVELALDRHGDEAVLRVDDDGPGVPPGQRTAIFERFTRLDDARDRRHGGAGLGLAIVTDVARAHGGSVEVTDSPLGGARFVVRLPVRGGGAPEAQR